MVTLRTRALTLFGVLGVLFAASGLLVTLMLARVDHENSLARDVYEPGSNQSQALLAALVDQESGERGYVITGDAAFLAPYRQGRVDETQRLASLHRLFADDPDIAAAVDEVASGAEAWRAIGPNPEIAALRAGDPATARGLIAAGHGKTAFDDLRGQVAHLQQLIDDRRTGAEQAATRASTTLKTTQLARIAVLAVAMIATIVLLRRWVLRPVSRLRSSLRQVADGDLDHPVYAGGPPEVAAIGQDAELMRRRIVDEVDTSRAAVEALAQHSPAVAGLRLELSSPGVRHLPGLDLAGVLHPAEGLLAGDWWEAVQRPDGSVAVVVTDVSGHGVGAGLVAVRFKHRIMALLGTELDLLTAFTASSTAIDADPERMLTCLVVELDPSTGSLRWVNAGHPAALVLTPSRNGVVTRELGPTGPLISAVSRGWAYEETTLEAGQILLAFTDGVVEARRDHAELGQAGVLDVVRARSRWTPAHLVDSVVEAVRRYADDWNRDDVTCVALTRAPAVL